jgi:hypothetical protein
MKEQIHAFTHSSVTKTIDNFGSFALIFNNLVGPAMLGFPHLFQKVGTLDKSMVVNLTIMLCVKAGVIPVILMIILVYICSSFCGTMLADAISSIPCNKKFERDIDFSTAFHIVVGKLYCFTSKIRFNLLQGANGMCSLKHFFSYRALCKLLLPS